MTNPLSKELYIVFCCVVCGALSGIWYDFFSAMRRRGINSKAVVMLQDGVFWAGETLLLFFVLFYANDGKLRWYEFFFAAFGFLAYKCLLSRGVVRLFECFMLLFVKLAKACKRLVLAPLKSMQRTVKKHQRTKLIRFMRRIFKRQH